MPSIEKLCFFLLGERARFPLEFRPNVLITAAIVVAVLRKTKTAVKQYNDPRISNSKSRPT